MHSFAVVASALVFAVATSAQSFSTGGVGRFPCGAAGGGADPSMCTNEAMTNNQVCPAAPGDEGLVDGQFKGNGLVPASATCFEVPNGFFCGIYGAPCVDGTNCDNGACSGGVCVAALGAACTLDSECSGSLYCLSAAGSTASGTCGGIGAFCSDGCAAGNFLCVSNVCDGNTGECVAAGTPGVSQRARARRTADILARGQRCPASHTACDLQGSVLGFECIDTQSNLEQCGACSTSGGVDCTSLPGVDAVGCVAGLCEIWACAEGYAWSVASAGCEAVLTL